MFPLPAGSRDAAQHWPLQLDTCTHTRTHSLTRTVKCCTWNMQKPGQAKWPQGIGDLRELCLPATLKTLHIQSVHSPCDETRVQSTRICWLAVGECVWPELAHAPAVQRSIGPWFQYIRLLRVHCPRRDAVRVFVSGPNSCRLACTALAAWWRHLAVYVH